MFKGKTVILLGALALGGTAAADFMTPSSYMITNGEKGYYYEIDETGTQLVDGIIGTNNWQEDLGNGNSYEWVGWLVANPHLSFTFDTPVKIEQVSIGPYQGNPIYVPKTVIINGKTFSLSGNEIAGGRKFLKFQGPFIGPNIEIALIDDNTGSWIFIDEVQFYTPSIQGTASWKTGHTVTCLNVTENKTVTLPKTKASAWDCEKAGLSVKSGDKIKVTIEGTRY